MNDALPVIKDPELQAIEICLSALFRLDHDSRVRALEYLASKLSVRG